MEKADGSSAGLCCHPTSEREPCLHAACAGSLEVLPHIQDFCRA